MANYLCSVSYNGAYFYGWQKQPRYRNTVEEEIENLLSKLLDSKIDIVGAGRTDKGVHALNQYFNFETDKEFDLEHLKYAFNRLIGPYIRLNSIKEVEKDMHARFSVKAKIYMYKVNIGPKDPFNEKTVYQLNRKVDVKAISDASYLFIGKHRFFNFTTKEEDDKDYVREIYDIEVTVDNDILTIKMIGNGFMRYMVRMIVGTLLKYGLGKIKLEKIKELLESKEPLGGATKAPAEGLYLFDVAY